MALPAQLFMDGNPITSTAVGLPVFPVSHGIVLGDPTGSGISESELRDFAVSTVPEPAVGLLGAAGILMLAMHRPARKSYTTSARM